MKTANLYDDSGCVLSVRNKGNDYYNYLSDAQGSTSTIMKDGKANNLYEYSDFGETRQLTNDNAVDNEICYTGAVLDSLTGLYYMNARYYNASNSRFISQDTYRGEEDDPMTWNLYTYCANNPINYIDPSGHKYSAKKAATYAYKWADGLNKKFKPFGADCTNFVSQCVNAGGYKMKKGYNWFDLHFGGKWCNFYDGKDWRVTNSWVNVTKFSSYMSKHYNVKTWFYWTDNGRKKAQKKAKKGDIIQLYRKKDREWCHSMFVYDISHEEKNGKKVKRVHCAQHSGKGPTIFFNKKLSKKYSGFKIIRPK